MFENQTAQDLSELQRRFHIPGVTIEPGEGGLTRIAVSTPQADAHVYLHGAHVTHFQPRGQGPVLFMSAASHFSPAKAIRGGVPVIFPWFGPKAGDPKAPQHGFVRNQPWTIQQITGESDGRVRVTLGFVDSAPTRAIWPYTFELLYTITVGPSLQMDLAVRNTGDVPFVFEEALHTYLAIGDVRRATVDGLSGREFIDKADSQQRKIQPPGAFGIDGETDRVYLNTPDTVVVKDATGPSGLRMLSVQKSGANSTIVWNPWIAKAKAMSDFGDDEWPKMICIETANAADNAVTLSPAQTHTLTAMVRVM